MEKFYIVKPDSKLHQEYWEWRNSVSENNKAIVDFFNENGISAIQYYSSKECLGIIPTDEDKEKFEKQFTKYAVDGGFRLFKKNSKIGKAWIAFTSTMTFKNRPSPAWYNKFFVGRSLSRLFVIMECYMRQWMQRRLKCLKVFLMKLRVVNFIKLWRK